MFQVDAYLGQIWYVVPMVRIRYYLRDIKHVLFSMFTKDYQPDPEYDEDEDAETRKADELYKTQLEAIKHGIPPPKSWSK
jgi:hypothetical protein